MTSHILWTSAEAAAVTNGKNTHPWEACGVSIDTRTIKKGDLFVALKGDRGDGHDHVAKALAAGAAAALVSRMPAQLMIGERSSALIDRSQTPWGRLKRGQHFSSYPCRQRLG